jgi:hypothetical protein
MRRRARFRFAGALLALLAGPVAAQPAEPPDAGAPDREQVQERAREELQVERRERVFGRDLMTEEELRQHHETLRSLRTEEERERFRKEHHERMLERARERGVEIPAEPGQGPGGGAGAGPPSGRGQGTGPGVGKGKGAGAGGGMGSGGGPGRKGAGGS